MANFTVDITTGCSPQLVQFTDQSTNNPTAWLWDLGNGSTSTQRNPSTIYISPGTYTIRLTATNAAGSNTITKTALITIQPTPVVDFTASPQQGCAPLAVSFTDQTTNTSGVSTTQWQWNFGDGVTSTQQNPAHTYNTPGNYTVILRATNAQGCSANASKAQYIKVGSIPDARFNFLVNPYCALPATVNFTNQSIGSTAYNWQFGDGATSTDASPSHTYTAYGNYTVRLIASNAAGCNDTVSQTISINPVAASFTTSAPACSGQAVQFTSGTSPVPLSASWNFGDGAMISTGLTPTHTYAAPGTYTVTLTAGYGGCSATATQTVVVNALPQASFTATPRQACTVPAVVSFQNTSVGANTYQWSFGDDSISTATAPVHTYINPGSFTVKLVAISAAGCRDSISVPTYIQITEPPLVLTGASGNGCLPYTIQPTFSGIDPAGITGIQWDFGDGTQDTQPAPSHTYTTQGTYTVTLTVTTSAGCTIVRKGIVKAGGLLLADFTATPNPACSSDTVRFISTLTPNGSYTYVWQFGDGSSNTIDLNPVHNYSGAGDYNVSLTIQNNGCDTTITKPKFIKVLPPTAKFRTEIDCANRMVVNIVDSSVGAFTYLWDFGDGTTSTLPSPPPHTYSNPGKYYITLHVTRDQCEHTRKDSVYIGNGPLTLTADNTTPCINVPVNFTLQHNSAFMVYSYEWAVDTLRGAGGSNTFSYAFRDTGYYTVTLFSTGYNGCRDSAILKNFIHVTGPRAAFTVTPQRGCSNQPVSFEDRSGLRAGGQLLQWQWSFGDGSGQTLTGNGNTSHQYNTQDSFIVKLVVTDNAGCVDTATSYVKTTLSDVSTFFTADTAACPGSPVQFAVQASASATGYTWYFGDGSSALVPGPSHVYANTGLYSIKLVVRGPNGCVDSVTKVNYLRIDTPHAVIGMSATEVACPPASIAFFNQSSFSFNTLWDFGDGNVSVLPNPTNDYITSGVYTIRLKVFGPGNGCADSTTRVLDVRGPRGTFSYTPLSGCVPLTVNFTASTIGAVRYVWDFADGATLSTNTPSASHVYTDFADYPPKIILQDATGCQVPVFGTDTIRAGGVLAGFTSDRQFGCDTGRIAFQNLSRSVGAGAVAYTWDFGDGTTSADPDPVHRYTATGAYNVTLRAVTVPGGCSSNFSVPAYIRIAASPRPAIVLSDTAACFPASFTFGHRLAPDTAAVTAYQWQFGNGNTSSAGQPVTQLFNTATGTFNNYLRVTNSLGCTGIDSQQVRVDTLPDVRVTDDFTLCENKPVRLQATNANIYSWSPSAGLSCDNCAAPFANPPAVQQYVVTGTDNNGCSGKDSVTIRVLKQYTVSHNPVSADVCLGRSITLSASGGAQQFRWTPATGLVSPNQPLTIATPLTSTTYRLIASDSLGCFNDTAFIPVTVHPMPKLTMPPDVQADIGTPVTLRPAASADVVSYAWTPAADLSCTTCATPSFIAVQDRQYLLTVTNAAGCKVSGTVNVFVKCLESSVFIPNTFSPNADGANDVFFVRGSGTFQVRALRVYNRWGQLVFEKRNGSANNPSDGWDGTFNGQQLDAAAFVYQADVICRNGQLFTFKGSVSLIR